MITYEYLCDSCKHREVVEYKMGKAPKSLCCNCCGGMANRIYSCSAIVTSPTHEAREGRGRG